MIISRVAFYERAKTVINPILMTPLDLIKPSDKVVFENLIAEAKPCVKYERNDFVLKRSPKKNTPIYWGALAPQTS